MVTKTIPCKMCGRLVTRTFETERHARHCTYAHCDECKRKNYENQLRKGRVKTKKSRFVGHLKNDEINEACDRFLEKRGIHFDKQIDIVFLPEDHTKAVAYGESAAKRYMKGVRDGN